MEPSLTAMTSPPGMKQPLSTYFLSTVKIWGPKCGTWNRVPCIQGTLRTWWTISRSSGASDKITTDWDVAYKSGWASLAFWNDLEDLDLWNLWFLLNRVARKRLRNVPRDCTAVWVTDTCMEDFRRSNPPTPLMHQVRGWFCSSARTSFVTLLFLARTTGSTHQCIYQLLGCVQQHCGWSGPVRIPTQTGCFHHLPIYTGHWSLLHQQWWGNVCLSFVPTDSLGSPQTFQRCDETSVVSFCWCLEACSHCRPVLFFLVNKHFNNQQGRALFHTPKNRSVQTTNKLKIDSFCQQKQVVLILFIAKQAEVCPEDVKL